MTDDDPIRRRDEEFRESFPWIPWDDPVKLTVVAEDGRVLVFWGCRFCIAAKGLKAQEMLREAENLAAWEKTDGFIEHMTIIHGA